jgi:hypothetical protein
MKMNSGNMTYGRKLVEAAVSGIGKQKAPSGNKPPVMLILKCLTGAALGTCADSLVPKRSPRLSRTAAFAGVGFLATLAWSTRNVTSAMARSAAKEIEKVRDEHWLEMNPINYA